jgi:hypothetical protein
LKRTKTENVKSLKRKLIKKTEKLWKHVKRGQLMSQFFYLKAYCHNILIRGSLIAFLLGFHAFVAKAIPNKNNRFEGDCSLDRISLDLFT